jgi:hypothetical protein
MSGTTINVTGDLTACTIVNRWLKPGTIGQGRKVLLAMLLVVAAGAVIGAATGLIGQGKSVEVPPGTLFEFRLTRPVTL